MTQDLSGLIKAPAHRNPNADVTTDQQGRPVTGDGVLVPRRNADGSLFTYTVTDTTTGAPLLVDDRTFNPAWHSLTPPKE